MFEIEFKDRRSSEFRILIQNIGRRQRAEEQIDVFEIPYRNEDLMVHSNTYKPYLRRMELATKEKKYIPQINSWLNGRGKLRTSVDSGGYFIASVINGLDREIISRLFDSINVTFKVNPFFYLDSGDLIVTITAATKIYNPGTIYSEPIIKIYGSGNIDLGIGNKIYSFKSVDEYIVVDSELKYVYKDTLNQGDKMTGDFPVFKVGDNDIAFTGNVSKIEITPKWREL